MTQDGQDETREQRYARQTAESYAALGRYVQTFELLTHSIRDGCIGLLGNTSLAQIVFHHHALTTNPLFEIWRAMVATKLRGEPTRFSKDDVSIAMQLMAHLAKSTEAVARMRNTLLHGTWFIGWAKPTQEDFAEISMQKLKITRDGYKIDSPIESVSDLQLQVDECTRIEELLIKLQGCVNASLHLKPMPGLISANIFFDKGVWSVSARGEYRQPSP